ncbi:hypothetical protein F5Y16DRAFT_237259 [Xylariaceae sp. FL0255]|nr:hypothetical protein F5Y16DRAFT_237259 [Xylariaceae sp. FL0255]
MEEFARFARESFVTDQGFRPPDIDEYGIISITATRDGFISYPPGTKRARDLVKYFTQEQSNIHDSETPLASFRAVVLSSPFEYGIKPGVPLLISQQHFLELIDSLEIDNAVLWLTLQRLDGLHRFQSTKADTYYFGQSDFSCIWTFDAKSLRTTAILISSNHDQWSQISELLSLHKNHIHSPFLLVYVSILAVCCIFDKEIMYKQSWGLATIEKQVGYGKDAFKLADRNNIPDLAIAIQAVGSTTNHIFSKQRHFRMFREILGEIEDVVRGPGIPITSGNEKLLATFPSLRARIRSSHDYLEYLKTKAERLSTVLLALMTHEDAAVNTELAESSRVIAEASKADSSSMKTVAILTMAFLPGTFIAALFAVPSLDWSSGTVITGHFWIYWAFTLPATALIFILWLLLDNRTALLNSIRKTRRLDDKLGKDLEERSSFSPNPTWLTRR